MNWSQTSVALNILNLSIFSLEAMCVKLVKYPHVIYCFFFFMRSWYDKFQVNIENLVCSYIFEQDTI